MMFVLSNMGWQMTGLRVPLLHFAKRAAEVLLVLTMAAVAARAQTVFSAPQNVSNSGSNAGYQQIAIDANGKINAVWIDNSAGSYAVLFSRSSNGGVSFSTPLNVSNHPGSGADGPQIGLDPKGNICIVWSDNSSGSYASFFTRSIDGGSSFSAPLLISNSGATSAGGVRIAVDASGNINLVWADTSPGYNAIFFSRSADGGTSFSSPINVSNNSLGAGSPPGIGVDPQGNIYVVWEGTSTLAGAPSGTTQDAFLSVSANGGTTFSSPVNYSGDQLNVFVSNPQVVATSMNSINLLWETAQGTGANLSLHYRPASNGGATLGSISSSSDFGQYDQVFPMAHMALDSTGAINVVWQQNCCTQGTSTILYARSTDSGNSFAVSTIANAFNNTPMPQLAIDSLNNINVAFYQDTGSGNGEISFMQSTNQGSTFSAPQTISGSNASAELPQMAFDTSNNLHLVWQQAVNSKSSSIFYSRSVALNSLSLAPSSVGGGGSSTGTVTMNGPAPLAGAVISLSSSNTGVASVPASVTMAAGATSASFTVTTGPVTASTNVTISAAYNGITENALLGVESSTLSLLSLSPSTVTGGTSSTGTINLSSAAPSGGAVVSLSSSDPSVAALPPSVTVPAGATSATFTVATTAVAASTSITITAASSGATQTASLTVLPPTLTSVSMAPARLTGGSSSTGTVILSGPAPSSGVAISLSSSDSSVAAVPSSVTVPAGATGVTFTTTTAPVAATASVTIFATNSGVTQSASLIVLPPVLMSLTLNPSSITGGGSSTGTVTLDGPAPAGGAVVFLSSSNGLAAMVPSSVTIPAYSTTATFTVSTLPVALTTNVTITASYKGVSRAAILTVRWLPSLLL
jgi:hypothetical protein